MQPLICSGIYQPNTEAQLTQIAGVQSCFACWKTFTAVDVLINKMPAFAASSPADQLVAIREHYADTSSA